MVKYKSKEENAKLIKNTKDDPRFNLPHVIVMKCKLDQILFDNVSVKTSADNDIPIDFLLTDIIDRTNNIVSHTYNFLQLFILYRYNNDLILPPIDKLLIQNIMKIISKKETKSGKPASSDSQIILDHLQIFYDEHYGPLFDKDNRVFNDKLNYVLNYEEDDIIKNIENNIIEHYSDYVDRYVNLIFDIDSLIKEVTNDKEKKSQIYDTYRKVKTDLLSLPNTELTSDEKFHQWINDNKQYLLPKESLLNEPIKPVKPRASDNKKKI